MGRASLFLCYNLRDFPDKAINNPDFLHLLAVHLLNLANQDFADKPVQCGLRFPVHPPGSASPPDRVGTSGCFLLLFQHRRHLHKPLLGEDAFGLIRIQA